MMKPYICPKCAAPLKIQYIRKYENKLISLRRFVCPKCLATVKTIEMPINGEYEVEHFHVKIGHKKIEI